MYHIITNPEAGKKRANQYLPHLFSLFEKDNIPFEVHITTGLMDGYYLARKFCQEDPDCAGIISMGGDGTAHEVVAGMVDAYDWSYTNRKIPIPLGIFPLGSGNDFLSTLEGSKNEAKYIRNQPVETLNINFFNKIRIGETRTIDVLNANGMAFLNIANVGLDARIAQNAIELKARYGQYAYLAAAYRSISAHKNLKLEIKADDKEISGEFTLAAVCNGQYYGGGMRVAPTAKIDDGKITLCLVKAMSKAKAMTIFPTVMIEQHVRLKAISYTECKNVTITLPDSKEILCLDGNIYPNKKTINFKVIPKVLDVFT